MASEKLFENKIKKYLKDNSCWYVKFFANQYTKIGVPDILACINGYFVGIEVKAPNGKPSELQKYNIRQINKGGGFAVVVRPDQWDKLIELIEYLFNNDLLRAEDAVVAINQFWKI